MSECIHAHRLSDYLDGHLTGEQRDELEAHLEAEPSCDCRRELEALRCLVEALRDLPSGPPPPRGWERLEAALDPVSRAWSGRRRWVAMAAAVVVGVLLLGWAVSRRGTDGPLPAAGTEPGDPEVPTVGFGRLDDPEVHAEVVQAVRREKLPAIAFREDRLVNAGAELRSLDALIELARSLPADPGDREFQEDLERLTSLREDLLNEMILQAQAERTATWQ